MQITALGMIETSGLLSAIEAADAGLKAADVRLLGTDYVRGGLVMVRFEGEVAAVQASVDAGAEAARRVGVVVSAHVIPRAMPEVFCMLASDPSVGPNRKYRGGCAACGGCEGGKREWEAYQRRLKQDGAGEETQPPARAGDTAKRADGARTEKAPEEPDPAGKQDRPSLEELSGWKVVRLRSHVRKLPGFPLTPNEIRYANKATLLDTLKKYMKDRKN